MVAILELGLLLETFGDEKFPGGLFLGWKVFGRNFSGFLNRIELMDIWGLHSGPLGLLGPVLDYIIVIVLFFSV